MTIRPVLRRTELTIALAESSNVPGGIVARLSIFLARIRAFPPSRTESVARSGVNYWLVLLCSRVASSPAPSAYRRVRAFVVPA